jgi:hypothetical protein
MPANPDPGARNRHAAGPHVAVPARCPFHKALAAACPPQAASHSAASSAVPVATLMLAAHSPHPALHVAPVACPASSAAQLCCPA